MNGEFVGPIWLVPCGSCGRSLDLCGSREGNRKYDLGGGLYRCLECQDSRVGPDSFVLQRDVDETGVSGTGVVAEGVRFSDGTVALRWTSDWPTSVVFHDRGMESVDAVHGHGGKTRVVWTWRPLNLTAQYAELAEHHRQCELAGTHLAELVKQKMMDDVTLVAAVQAWDEHQWPNL